jgi:epoxyqueuosine reductase
MKTKKTAGELEQQLQEAGFKGVVVSTDHLPELRCAYGRLLEEGNLDKDFYSEIVSRYGLQWDFEPFAKLPAARSVIITAAQQPKISLEFQYDGKKYYGIIPPTYVHDTDNAILRVLSTHLHKHGYEVCDALLPTKLLAVRSGLAKYGRNNIAYIDGWGSYFRLRAFFSDAPCKNDQWREPLIMRLCNKCTACVKKCPTSAISKERFLMDAGKCLTFLNEGNEEFPEWLDLGWHNCLIGCMVCQDVCPANKDHINWLMPGEEFREEETSMILDGISHESLPEKTCEKLRKVGLLDNYELLGRNLKALIDNAKGRGVS